MPDADGTIRGPEYDVREVGGGRRIYRAKRLATGNWLVVDKSSGTRQTINNEDFCNGYERMPA